MKYCVKWNDKDGTKIRTFDNVHEANLFYTNMKFYLYDQTLDVDDWYEIRLYRVNDNGEHYSYGLYDRINGKHMEDLKNE